MIPGGYCPDCKWWNLGDSGPERECMRAWFPGFLLEGVASKPPRHEKGYVLTAPDFGCVQWEQKEN